MKNYMVIGHSAGIGKAIAQKLTTDNIVYGTYCSHPAAGDGANLRSHYLDVLADTYDLGFLPDTLDGIVYCPGAINLKSFQRIKPEEFMTDYKLQVLGAVKMIQQCLPRLRHSEAASIVFFSTVAVQMGFSFHSLVSASKGAIEGLTKALAAELAPKIRVNCIAPSITQTPLAEPLLNSPEKLAANAQRHPLKKIGNPEDIANAALYLLTDKSAWVTGQILHVDGGMGAIRM